MKDTEFKLVVASFIKGDLRAFEIIYNQFYEALCLYALRYTPDRSLAEDIVQDTFVDLWIHRKGISEEHSFKSYIYRIVYNKLMDVFRQDAKTQKMYASYYQQPMAQFISTLDAEPGYREELMTKLKYCIDKLPNRCKEVFLKTKMAGLKYSETAKVLNLSIKTVEGHVGRAYVFIKDCLKVFNLKTI
ncbi:RNA polymerase sigma-70 factor [Confluentibacter sediminis]|uniref:RNA polymerase sigma-70 factor n=1 Tax=Confluentibacter sediminis TaxID=2219045 RepID=UPI000DAE609C|nr:RNA polymerase sigma-70 factor [Confluentibacter sediminis]